MNGKGCAWPGGMCGRGGHVWQRGVHGRRDMCGRRDGHCSRRYASYWNAYLFSLCSPVNDIIQTRKYVGGKDAPGGSVEVVPL